MNNKEWNNKYKAIYKAKHMPVCLSATAYAMLCHMRSFMSSPSTEQFFSRPETSEDQQSSGRSVAVAAPAARPRRPHHPSAERCCPAAATTRPTSRCVRCAAQPRTVRVHAGCAQRVKAVVQWYRTAGAGRRTECRNQERYPQQACRNGTCVCVCTVCRRWQRCVRACTGGIRKAGVQTPSQTVPVQREPAVCSGKRSMCAAWCVVAEPGR